MPSAPSTSPTPSRRSALLAGGLLVVLTLAVYGTALRGPFLFDDTSAVLENPTIRRLWPIGDVLHPPPNSTVSGRPLLNLSFALNHALGGLDPFGYHAFNLLLHLLAGLALFGLVRRTLLAPRLQARFGEWSLAISASVAAVWLLHPVQTASVTYISQRAEVMMGFFYLLALYAYARSALPGTTWRWSIVAVGAALLGALTKEVALTLPLAALLYDRAFLSGSFGEAWRQRHWQLISLALTWVITVTQLSTLKQHGVGLGLGADPLAYLATETGVIVRYLGLALWPNPLVFDYGEDLGFSAAGVTISACMVAVLVLVAVYALIRKPGLGFLAAMFFVLLAPTSSFVPIVHQPMAENRIYLPLATVVMLVSVAASSVLGRRVFLIGATSLAVVLGSLTVIRNRDFHDEIRLWQDTVRKRPENARAHYNLGVALAQSGRSAEAVTAYESALALKPNYAEAQHNLANSLARLGRPADAVPHYETALHLVPNYSAAHYDLAITLQELGRTNDAIGHFEAALRIEPDSAVTHSRLADALARQGRRTEAYRHYEAATRLQPDYPEALTNWGNALAQDSRWADAIDRYQRALKSSPDYVAAHINLGNAFYALQRINEAVEQFELAVRLAPRSAAAHYNLGNLELARGHLPDAIRLFEKALTLDPTLAGAHHNLALALVGSGRAVEALAHYRETLRLVPDSAAAHHNLALALGQLGLFTEAAAHEEAALGLQPEFMEARDHLEWLRRQQSAPK